MSVIGSSVFEVIYKQSYDGQDMFNVLHYRQPSTDPDNVTLAGQAAQIIDYAVANWTANIPAFTVVDAVLNTVIVNQYDTFQLSPPIPPATVLTPQKLLPLLAAQVVSVLEEPVPGLITGDGLPRFNAIRARKLTAGAGRRRRGHISIGGIGENQTTKDRLNDASYAAWQASSAVFLNYVMAISIGFDVNGFLKPCVFSVTQAQVDNTPGQVAGLYGYYLTSTVANSKIGTMRRRKLRGGVA